LDQPIADAAAPSRRTDPHRDQLDHAWLIAGHTGCHPNGLFVQQGDDVVRTRQRQPVAPPLGTVALALPVRDRVPLPGVTPLSDRQRAFLRL
jgi:hypothetical protein